MFKVKLYNIEDRKEYYKKQLDLLKELDYVTVMLTDFKGNKTNAMSLNSDSVAVLIEFLQQFKDKNKL
ncbi:hypothetical protein M0R04_11695 [Candidatus Dojkabacteria bacterium]|jgi:hypothetical protein|nr:hypothetical protein [Candidatus Dojkabacteria bacterium]